ncbi:MAG TPA: M23 family metallopeptidase, partial [Verrucomicrobiae bacterium]|nr:M23 family metallopeptidase [Verrucomicrobiae bacterium]
MTRLLPGLLPAIVLLVPFGVAQPFRFPTANHSLYEKGGGEKFLVGTPGKPWTTGAFGCVRTDGWQMHEGLDIRCLQRDRQGEPIDPVMATADGTVAYVNRQPGLSNYGNYIILRHQVDGLEIYSLYAHLSQVGPGLAVGQRVKGGDTIGRMGRTSNTRQRITKDRAHVHLEYDLVINERFDEWHKRHAPGQRNDHGMWNGKNLLGIDPRWLYLAEAEHGARFNLLQFMRSQTELCRVMVRETRFPWLRRYGSLVQRNPVAEREGIAGYEVSLNFNGVPFNLIPRAASEMKSG